MVRTIGNITSYDSCNDPSSCGICGECVSNVDEGMQCVRCDLWVHRRCSTVGKLLYDALVNDQTEEVVFMCAPCVRKRRRRLRSSTPDIEPALSACNTSATIPAMASKAQGSSASAHPKRQLSCSCSESCQCENEAAEDWIKKKPKRKRRKEKPSLESPPTVPESLATIPPATTTDSTQSTPRTERRLAPRENCLIIFGVPESVKESSSERFEEDVDHLRTIADRLMDNGEDAAPVLTLFRLGKKSIEPNGRPRPLKAVFTCHEDPSRLLKKSYKLLNTDYRIRPDRSPDDRERMRQAVISLHKRLESGESNLTIRDFQVVPQHRPKRQLILLRGRASA